MLVQCLPSKLHDMHLGYTGQPVRVNIAQVRILLAAFIALDGMGLI